MSKYTHNLVNGVQVILTSEEIAELEARDAALEQQQIAEQTAEQAKIDLKASAHAKLAALGLTADEIAALGA